MGFCTLLAKHGQGKRCVELARLIDLFGVGLAQRRQSFGSYRFLFERWPEIVLLGSCSLLFYFASGLSSFLLELRFWGLLLGFHSFVAWAV